ncbi:MAG TPA: MarR family transcriptional regulator, partial [Spirochaetota bacterium]
MSLSPVNAASELFYRTLPLIKKIFLYSQTEPCGKLPAHLFSTLLCIHFNGKMKMSDISERLGLSKPLVTQHTERLVAEGYIVRSADPYDRRIVSIEITPQGSAYAKGITSYFQEKGAKALSKLSADDLKR